MSYSYGTYVRRGLLIAVLICVPAAMAKAGDAWSPGAATGEAWQRIQRLQSVSQTARVRSPFVTQCLESNYAIERAAAVCWVVRTRSAVHAADLEKRLSDECAVVRQLAWNALLNLPNAEAIGIVLRNVETQSELPEVFHSGGMSSGSMVVDGSLAKRRTWLASLGDRDAWIKSFLKRQLEDNLSPPLPSVELKSCILDSDDNVFFVVKSLEELREPRTQSLRANMGSLILEHNARESMMNRSYPPTKSAEIVDGGLQVRLMEKDTLSPGVYSLSVDLDSGMGSGVAGSFPFFVRVHRTEDQEREVQQLLGEPLDDSAVGRLGLLRASAAVPKLIEYFESHGGCERTSAGRALAMIGDARAASVFLKAPHWGCGDSGWTCFQEFFELDAPVREICDEKIFEIGSRLRDQLSEVNEFKKRPRVTDLQLALYRCQRPLNEKQVKVLIDVIQQFKQAAIQAPEQERIYHYMEMSPLIIAYLGTDASNTTAWLKANQDQPELILQFLRELTWPAPKENTRFEYSSRFWQALYDELTHWKSSAQLSPEQIMRLTRSISEIQNEIDEPYQ